MSKNTKYYVGLDVGTESVGWAVTDENYNVQTANSKKLWGTRLFEEGQVAADRRAFRSARRRADRKINRIKLLQELFDTCVCEIDKNFFMRLNESFFYPDDKSIEQTNSLFNDVNYKDKDYYKEYPTIYHLRKELIECDDKKDIRLIYLAIEHILKHRGHFLFEGKSFETIPSFETVFSSLNQSLFDEFDIMLDDSHLEDAKEIIKSRDINITNKKKELSRIFEANEPQTKAIVALLAGGKVKLSLIFLNEEYDENDIKSITFKGSEYQEKYDEICDVLKDKIHITDLVKSIYDWGVLEDILKDEDYISCAKVKSYEKHRDDLKKLKSVVKKYIPQKYKEIFSDTELKDNYCAYIGMNKKNANKQIIKNIKCTQEDLCKYISKYFEKIKSDDKDLDYIKQSLENRTLLPKQKIKDNSIIPYQLHLAELVRILENATKHYTFLNENDDGISVKEKVIKIFTYKIPYYVGPINNTHKEKGGNCWIVKKDENVKIRPWNFDNVVDLEASAEQFILRMTSKCSYLVGADVLPKNSILYSKFMVLNELNNLRVNTELISVEVKKLLYEELFCKNKKVTRKRLHGFLLANGIMSEDSLISGVDGDFKSTMASYIDMKNILAGYYEEKMAENIIKWITIFGDDKKILKTKILKEYNLPSDTISRLSKLRYSGWGRLSKELLMNIKHINKETGEVISLISAMYNTNENLMQLLSNNYDYTNNINKYNKKKNNICDILDYSTIGDLYVSPAIKRSIWQTMLIVKEINKIMKHAPQKIFVEVARGEGEKKRTQSRKKQLEELYAKCKSESAQLMEQLEMKTDSQLRSKKLYLYFKQMGKCMYSGETIDLDNLFDANIYDIDHIYPQSKVKDDSLDNTVLVKKDANAEKSDKYPIPSKFMQLELWRGLYKKELISKKKYERLTRTTGFKDNELADFIARQLVETRQSTKAIAQILNQYYPDSRVVYVKAGNVSDFRQKYELVKVREINDYHHAKDAYLNIVVGNVYDTKFTRNPINFIKDSNGRDYNIKRMYDFDVKRGSKIAWIAGDSGSISNVIKTMKRNDVLFTRYSFTQKGAFYKQQLKKKGHGQIPIKTNDERYRNIDRYGAYDKDAGAYFFLVKHDEIKVTKKKTISKTIKTFEYIPIRLMNVIKTEDDLIKYCIDELKLVNPLILIPKVKMNSLFDVDDFYMHLSGRTGSQLVFKGANQLILNHHQEKYLKKIVKYVDRDKKSQNDLQISKYDEISAEKNIEIYDTFINKLKHTLYGKRLSSQIPTLETGRKKFTELKLEEQCKTLYEILHMFKCNPVSANLQMIGGPSVAGRLYLSKNITSVNNIKLVHQSSTGIFDNKINISEL